MKYRRGVVIGKFYPPHRGHHHLINTGLSQCDELTVIICAKDSDQIPGEQRRTWLQEIHPRAKIVILDDTYDADDTAVWAENTLKILGGPPDVVFTSEDYGEPYARQMGAEHVSVDRERVTIPCSGTKIRQNPLGQLDFLEPPVRSWFVRKVCVLGAESTGTTTLAKALAEHYQTVWVPEYGREYSQQKMDRGGSGWTSCEFVEIAREQMRREEEARRKAGRVLICDTNAFATCLWHRRYMGFDLPELEPLGVRSPPDLYLLTGDEIPFVQDGLRDGEHIRHEMHGWFEKALSSQSVPWILLHGSPEDRLADAVRAVDVLLNKPFFK